MPICLDNPCVAPAPSGASGSQNFRTMVMCLIWRTEKRVRHLFPPTRAELKEGLLLTQPNNCGEGLGLVLSYAPILSYARRVVVLGGATITADSNEQRYRVVYAC